MQLPNNIPDFREFVLPYGPRTGMNYSGPAANAYGNMVSGLANAYGGMYGSFANAAANQEAATANANANRYNSFAGGLANNAGAYSSGLANAYGSYGGLLSGLGGSGAASYQGLASGLSGLAGGRANQAASKDNAYTGMATGLGAAAANAYGSYGSTLAGLANAQSNDAASRAQAFSAMMGSANNAYGNTYGSYASGLSNLASAAATEAGNRYNAMAMADAARSAAAGNIGSSALGAYGSAAGSALGSWAQAEAAYQNAMGNIGAANQSAIGNVGSSAQAANANIGAANQQAVSGLGQSRNSAIASLANSYAQAGSGLAGAALAGDLDLDFEDFGYTDGAIGGGVQASGPGGPIATGSYSGGGGGSSNGMKLTASRSSDNSALEGVTDRTFGGLESLGSMLDNSQGYGQLRGSLADSYGQVGATSSDAYRELERGLEAAQPSRPDSSFLSSTLNNTLAGIQGLAAQGYMSTGQGGSDYGPSVNYGSILDRLADGFGQANDSIGSNVGLAARSGAFAGGDYGGYSRQAGRQFDATGDRLDNLAENAQANIGGTNYADSDLLAGLLGGQGATLGQLGQFAASGRNALFDTAGALENSRMSTANDISSQYREYQPENVAADILRNASLPAEEGEEESYANPYRQSLLREYESLMRSGPTSRFNNMSPDYDANAAKRKQWIERNLRAYGGLPLA